MLLAAPYVTIGLMMICPVGDPLPFPHNADEKKEFSVGSWFLSEVNFNEAKSRSIQQLMRMKRIFHIGVIFNDLRYISQTPPAYNFCNSYALS